MTEIPFRRRKVRLNLAFAVLWLALGGSKFIFNPELVKWSDYFYLLLFVVYTIIFFYQNKYPYITVDKDFVKRYGVTNRIMSMNDFVELQEVKGGIRIVGKEEAIFVNPRLLEVDDVHRLVEALEEASSGKAEELDA